MNNIETAIQFVKRPLKEQLGLDVTFTEGYGVDFFPQFIKGMNEILYDKKLETLLWLYNMVFHGKGLTSKTITHYQLFYACLNSEKYDQAEKHLLAFEEDVKKLQPDEEVNDEIINQLAFIMLHELYHVIFYSKPVVKEKALVSERQRQTEIKEELEQMLKTITPEEIFAMPQVQPRIKALFTSFVPKSMKKKIVEYIIDGLVKPEDYDAKVLGDDSSLLEEMACDRSAWQYIMEICKSADVSKEDLADVHCSLLISLTAMFVNEAFLAHYFPEKHADSHYDAKTIIIRQNAFKRLDQYVPIEYKNVSGDYLHVAEQVEQVYKESIQSFVRYKDDIGKIYLGNEDNQPKNERWTEYNDRMSKIVQSIGTPL